MAKPDAPLVRGWRDLAEEGFLYAEFKLQDGMLRDGWNEIGFALREDAAAVTENVTVQEVEIRVVPG